MEIVEKFQTCITPEIEQVTELTLVTK